MVPSEPIYLSCILSAESPQNIDDGVWLKYTIQSTHKRPFKLLPWHTPLEGIFSDLFIIKDAQDNALVYQGPMVKRAAPTIDDYVYVTSNEVVTHRVKISRVYSMKQGGIYSVKLKKPLLNIIGDNNKQQSVSCDTNQISISVK